MSSASLAIPDDPAKVLRESDDPQAFVLVALDRAKSWLTTANSVTDVAQVKAQAEAIRAYSVQANLGRDSEQAACEIRIRAERRIGQLLSEEQAAKRVASRGGDRRSKSAPPTLKDVGLSKEESSEFQKLAAIPEEKFDDVVKTARDDHSLSRAAVLREGAAEQEEREHQEALAAHELKPLTDQAEIKRLNERNLAISRSPG